MVNKNDLSAFKPGNKQVLKVVEADRDEATTTKTKTRTKAKTKTRTKPPEEKRSHKILLSLTEGEGAKIKEKAGMVPIATYLVALLREQGLFD